MKIHNVKSFLYLVVCIALFVVSFHFSHPIWFLFVVLSVYFAYRSFNKVVVKEGRAIDTFVPTQYGVIGTYEVDGDQNDPSFGMYIELQGKPVFVDIREDRHLEARKVQALALNKNKEALEASIRKFISQNPDFGNRTLKSIGLHSDNLTEGEVFWDPDGYSLLEGLQFTKIRTL